MFETLPLEDRIQFRSTLELEVIKQCGDDSLICHAAWVSTQDDVAAAVKRYLETTDVSLEQAKKERGLLKFLMEHQHGTPYEMGWLCCRVAAPIFVWREWHRHRIAWSYNEESGRYKKLRPIFYVPGEERREHSLKPTDFKPSKPGYRGFLPCPEESWTEHNDALKGLYLEAYALYEDRLDAQFDNGLARISLPVGLFSECYVACNPRSIMSFLELRTDMETAIRRSHPLFEMDNIALQLEDAFKQYWPVTHELWNANGRQAP